MDPRRFFNSLPVAGGVLSGIWGDPGQEAHQAAMQQAQEMLKGYRSDQMDSRVNAMNQGALGFAPRNQMLGQMMGQQGPAMDLAPMMQNPMSQGMQGNIRQAAFGTAPPTDGRPMGAGWNGVGPQNPYRPV